MTQYMLTQLNDCRNVVMKSVTVFVATAA